MIAIVDYGMGNLHSVRLALEAIGARCTVTHSPEELLASDRVILPGVGAFGECVQNLKASGMFEALTEHVVRRGRPLLGICLGMQVLADEGEELGVHAGLGWIPGRVRRLRAADHGLRVPHIGWNGARRVVDHPVLADLDDASTFYYVHSFAFDTKERAHAIAECDYGEPFTCAVARDNIVATQFHPEKSQRAGLAILERFSRWVP